MNRLLVVLMCLFLSAPVLAQGRVIAPQPDAPVGLDEYIADYGGPRGGPSQIAHSIQFKNTSDQAIDAIQVTFVSFDAFNDVLGSTNGTLVETIRSEQAGRVTAAHNPDGASGYYTGVAFVNKVRFADGNVWEANLRDLFSELRKVDPDMTEDDL